MYAIHTEVIQAKYKMTEASVKIQIGNENLGFYTSKLPLFLSFWYLVYLAAFGRVRKSKN